MAEEKLPYIICVEVYNSENIGNSYSELRKLNNKNDIFG